MELTIDGRRAYAATGNRDITAERDTVVFVHGVGQDHTVWVLPTRYFARHDRNVIAVDLPGRGRSDGPPLASIEEMSEWLVEMLDALDVERAAVVGHSMGSLVALDFGSRHSQRVRSIVMVGVSFPLRVNDALMETADAGRHETLDMLTYWGHSRAAQLGGNDTPGIWMAGAHMRLLEQAAPEAIAADLRACDDYDGGIEAAGAIACPALLLLGERDVMTPVRGARALIEALPNSETVMFQRAGHSLLTERPEQVLDQLIRIV